MREAVYRLNNEKTDKLAEYYEKMYVRKHSASNQRNPNLLNTSRSESRNCNFLFKYEIIMY